MLVRPVTRTNFLGEVTYKDVTVNEETDNVIKTIANSKDDINITISKNVDSFESENDRYTVYTSKKIPKKLDGKGGWKSAIHTVTRYEDVSVPKGSSIDTLSAMIRETLVTKVIAALGKRVEEHTGKNPEFLKYLK